MAEKQTADERKAAARSRDNERRRQQRAEARAATSKEPQKRGQEPSRSPVKATGPSVPAKRAEPANRTAPEPQHEQHLETYRGTNIEAVHPLAAQRIHGVRQAAAEEARDLADAYRAFVGEPEAPGRLNTLAAQEAHGRSNTR